MKRMLLIPVLMLLVMAGCGGYRDKQAEGAPSGQSSPPSPPGFDKQAPQAPNNDAGGPSGAPAPVPVPEPAQRKIIRNGQISLTVKSLDSAEAKLARLAAGSGGYISNTSRSRSNGNALSGTTELRIPSDRFDAALAGIRVLGELENESITSSDVTAEFIDLEARLKTQQELEARLLALLQDRGGKLADIIEIESKLAQVRTEIEAAQGRMRFLQQQVSYSTLAVTMMEPGAIGENSSETFGGRMGSAFRTGIDGLVEVMGILITTVLALLPIAGIVLALYFFIIRPWRNRRNAQREMQKSSVPKSNV